MRLALFGPPGAGKGTQADLLVQRFGLKHISTGNIIRDAIKRRTPIGLEALEIVNKGQLVSGAIVKRLAESALDEADCDQFVLDGYPRTIEQAKWLTEFLTRRNAPMLAVVSLVVPDPIIVGRLSKRRMNKDTGESYHLDFNPPPPDVPRESIVQRPDDMPDAIMKRIQVYKDETLPLIEYYAERGLLEEIDGVGSLEDVKTRILDALQNRLDQV